MRSKLIANPRAGRKGGLPTNAATLDDALAALAVHGITPDVATTERAGHATELARQAAREGYEAVIAAGGDGTAREAAIGLLGTQVPLGIMPLGSIMNVAHMLGIPRDLDSAAAIIAAGDAAPIDVGRAGNSYFLEAAGVGIDALLFRYAGEIDQGRWDRLWAGLRAGLAYRPRRVALELDGWTVEIDAVMVTIANGPYCGAGFHFAPEATVDDHRLDVRVFGPMSRMALLRQVWGPRPREPGGKVYSFKARDVRVAASPPLPAHADAVPIGTTPLRFAVMPDALAVFAGPGARRSTPTAARDERALETPSSLARRA